MNTDTINTYFFKLSEWSKLGHLDGLSPSEKQQHQRFANKVLKQKYAICHQLKRQVLAKHLGQAADQIQILTTETGKPYLCPEHNLENIHFNLSHTNHYLMIGVTAGQSIGVDIEELRQQDSLAIAKRFFHPAETAYIQQTDDPNTTFIEIWVQKEAYVKQSGIGIASGLEKFNVLELDSVKLVETPFQNKIFAGISSAKPVKTIRMHSSLT